MADSYMEGGCLCGHIRYRAAGSPHSVTHCHCEQCRRYTGAICATGVAHKAENIDWLNGEPTLYRESDASINGRSFCPKCGSSIADHKLTDGDIWLYVGTLDHPATVAPQNHIFIEEKIPWVSIDDGLQKFDKGVT